jgi:hydrogenase maturation protease
MTEARPRVLVIGYGNPGRLDDGLGPACAAALEAKDIPGVTVDSCYQLDPEVAESVSRHDAVVFVDAAVAGPEPFLLSEVTPADSLPFSSHGLGPGEVVGLARQLFGSRAPGYTLAIRGYDFDEFGESLSEPARQNLDRALAFLEGLLLEGDLRSLAERCTLTPPGGELAPSVGN